MNSNKSIIFIDNFGFKRFDEEVQPTPKPRIRKRTSNISKKTTFSQTERRNKVIEDIFEVIGYSKYQFLLICIVFLNLSVDGIHLTLMSSMFIPLKSYFLIDSNLAIEIASGIIFLGVGLGSFLISYLLNYYERELLLKVSYLFIVFFHFLMVFTSNIIFFSILRFFLGIFLGILIPISLNVLCEYLPQKLRSYTLISIWAAYCIGQSLPLVLMMIFMPDFQMNKVQIILLILWIYVFIAAILVVVFFKDSPRNLILNGRNQEAIEILKDMCDDHGIEINPDLEYDILSYVNKGVNSTFKTHSFVEIFKEGYIVTTLLLIVIWVIESFLLFGVLFIYTPTLKALNLIDDSNIILSLLLATFIGVVFILTMPLLSEVESIGTRKLCIIIYILALIFSILIVALTNLIFVWMPLFIILLSTTYDIITTYTGSIYPTVIRDSALGFYFATNRIGAFLSQLFFLWIFEISTMLPYYIMIGFVVINIICVIFLQKEPTGHAIDRKMTIA